SPRRTPDRHPSPPPRTVTRRIPHPRNPRFCDDAHVAAPRTRRRRRIRIAAVLGVTTVLVAACLITWARIPRDDLAMLEAGSLHIDPRVPAAASARGLTVTIDRGSDNPDDSDDSDTDSDTEPNTGDDTGPRITVRSGHAAVWSSDPGHAFLGAGRGELTAEEDRGYFWLRSDHDREWT